ncbi:G2/mitotic-specific cyclin S13-7-like protein [Tanacetum coccineum]|uniref:G2/mitotic-specific cyclin S13-7-like protein n=1 Tax=Tanacetum coccineum TaxID=301880 RepID=A0ABQ4YGD6_9ASTR
MTSVVDHRQQPIIAQGERRERRALGDITNRVTTRTRVNARSKVASGIATTKPIYPVIINIDEVDKNNELAQVEYVEEIYLFYKISEIKGCLRDYMDFQHDINARMRAILLDWLIQVHDKYGLMPETLYLTINIVDRYLSVTTTSRTELQLVGISALLLSSKYEEIWPLAVNDMITISDSAYSREQILAMEKAILSRLDGEYGVLTIRNNPSMLAASAVYAARCTLNKTPAWSETLQHYTGYTEDQLGDCAKSLVRFHASASDNKFSAVYKKYLNPDTGTVARFPPTTSLLVVNRHLDNNILEIAQVKTAMQNELSQLDTPRYG